MKIWIHALAAGVMLTGCSAERWAERDAVVACERMLGQLLADSGSAVIPEPQARAAEGEDGFLVSWDAGSGLQVAGAEAGERWGRRIAQSRPVDPSKPLDPRTETVTVLAGYGFAPRPGSREVVELTRCPLLDAARQYPEVVCSVHLGLVRGLISERGGDPTGTDLEPFATEDACRLHLPRTTSA